VTDEEEIRKKVREVIITTFRLTPSQSIGPLSIDTVPAWDSLGHIELISCLSKEFSVSISHAEAIEMLDEDSVIDVILRKCSLS